MKIIEFRIILPTTVERYRVANRYMIAVKSKEESGQVAGEGVEVVTLEDFANETESGVYSYKILHFKSRIPGFMRWAMPDSYCHCHEKAWNAYPHFHTEYNVPGLGDNMMMSVDSQHVDFNPGEDFPDNATGMSAEDLAMRKIVYLDIVRSKPKDKKKKMRGFVCPEGGIETPLDPPTKPKVNETKIPTWTKDYKGPMMCAVKVVKFQFKWWGLQSGVESYTMNTLYHDLFLDAHRDVVLWAGKWYPMSVEDVVALEKELVDQCNAMEFERDDNAQDEKPPDGPPPGTPAPPSGTPPLQE